MPQFLLANELGPSRRPQAPAYRLGGVQQVAPGAVDPARLRQMLSQRLLEMGQGPMNLEPFSNEQLLQLLQQLQNRQMQRFPTPTYGIRG